MKYSFRKYLFERDNAQWERGWIPGGAWAEYFAPRWLIVFVEGPILVAILIILCGQNLEDVGWSKWFIIGVYPLILFGVYIHYLIKKEKMKSKRR